MQHDIEMLATQKSNALIVLLYIFQQGLLLPLSFFISFDIALIACTVLIAGYALVSMRFAISMKTIILFLVPLTLLLLKLPFEDISDGTNFSLRFLASFLTIGVSGILIGTIPFSRSVFLNLGLKISWINFLLICWIPLSSKYGVGDGQINYMRFGYAILPSILFSFWHIINGKRKKFSILLFLGTLAECLIFGARGATLTAVFLMFLYFLLLSKQKNLQKALIIIGIGLASLTLNQIMLSLPETLTSLGINSYAINKYTSFVESESLAETSSGRTTIYITAWERFKTSPIMGSPLDSCFTDTEFEYYHNIFLDLLVNFGLFVFLFFIYYLVNRILFVWKKKDKEQSFIFLVLLLLPLGRLLLSSSLWLRPEFWLFMGYSANLGSRTTYLKYQSGC